MENFGGIVTRWGKLTNPVLGRSLSASTLQKSSIYFCRILQNLAVRELREFPQLKPELCDGETAANTLIATFAVFDFSINGKVNTQQLLSKKPVSVNNPDSPETAISGCGWD